MKSKPDRQLVSLGLKCICYQLVMLLLRYGMISRNGTELT